MPNLYTPVQIPEFPFSIGYQDQIMLIGSCFSEHIYQRLDQFQFRVLSNPFGISYNPISIANGLRQIRSGKFVPEGDLFYHNECYHAFDFHGQFSDPDKRLALEQMNASLSDAASFLPNTSLLIITLGTANVFRLKSDHRILNNCHKIPGAQFEKEMLSVDEIVGAMNEVFTDLLTLNPGLQVLLTVSPIRHIRDGLMTNQQSKSTLLLATRQLTKDHSSVHYFPSYEIMMDELRDYRFYKEDMIHPSDWSVNFIWEKFKTAFFNDETQKITNALEKIMLAAKHRPKFPQSKGHQLFVQAQIDKIKQLTKKYPVLDQKKMFDWFL